MAKSLRVYAFDVDETLEVSKGPVTLQMVLDLKLQGHIVGVIGNWAVLVNRFPQWHQVFSFLGPMAMTKENFMTMLAKYTPADEFIMVGNDDRDPKWGNRTVSQDGLAAQYAGWKFISEDDFASGTR
jgi:hypothetical protein